MKKFRFLSIIFFIITLLSVLCSCEDSNGGFAFELTSDENSYIVSKYKGRDTDVIIPSSYNELPVTIIGHEAFRGKKKITNIDIPNSITSIEYQAFEGCSSLTNVVIPDSVTNIGNDAFRGCSSFTNVVIPNSVTGIGYKAFADCNNLESVTIPFVGCEPNDENKVTYLGSVFGGETTINVPTNKTLPESLKEVIITSGTSIGATAFAQCEYIERVEIPSSVVSIGQGAFHRCSSLSSIEIPSSVASIAVGAFYGCISLTSVTFEEGSQLTSIDNSVFEDCSSLSSIEIPSSVASIAVGAFYGCISLTNIVLPESVTSIGNRVFSNCSSLIIYCETEEKPSDWSADWDVFGKTSEERLTIYWSGQWEYDANGNPVPLS